MRNLRALPFAALLVAPSACSGAPLTDHGHPIIATLGGQAIVRGLSAGGGYVYFTETDPPSAQTVTLLRVPDAGGTPQPIVSGIAPSSALAVGGESVYWLDGGGTLYSAPASGVAPGASPTILAANLPFAEGLVVAGGVPYVLEYNQLPNGSVVGFGTDGTGAPTTVASGPILALVSDGSALYFATQPMCTPLPGCAVSTVWRYVPGAGAPTTLFTTPLQVPALATDGTHLYAAEQGYANDLTQLVVAPTAGGEVLSLASGLSNVKALAAASDGVYYAAWTSGLWKEPLTGGPPVQVTPTTCENVSADDSGVYAVDDGGNQGEWVVAASR